LANKFDNGTTGIAVNPIVIDTAFAAVPAALTAIAQGGRQAFKRIVWTVPAATTDTLSITDINGNVLFNEKCSVAGQDVLLWDDAVNPYLFKQSQWLVPTIGSGKLLLYK